MRLVRSGFLLVFLTVPVAGWSQKASLAPASLSGQLTGDEKTEKKELRRFREALATLQSSTELLEIKRSLQVLRDGFPASRPVLHAAAGASSARVRGLAIKLLGDQGNVDEDLDVVAKALDDKTSSVRMAAVMALRRLGKEGSPAIVRHLPRELEPNIRKMAVMNLKIWGDPDAIPVLARSLRKERDRGVRRHTVRALRSLSGKIYGDDTDAWVAFAEDYLYRKNEKRILEYTRSLPDDNSTRSRKRK